MSLDPKVIDAQNLVEIRRARLMTSVKYGIGEAKRRLAPDLVADHVWEVTKDKAERAAHDMVVSAKNNPWTVGAIGTAIGLFFARGKIGDAVRDQWGKWTDDEPTPPAPSTPATPAEVAKKTRKPSPAKPPKARATKTEEVK